MKYNFAFAIDGFPYSVALGSLCIYGCVWLHAFHSKLWRLGSSLKKILHYEIPGAT